MNSSNGDNLIDQIAMQEGDEGEKREGTAGEESKVRTVAEAESAGTA